MVNSNSDRINSAEIDDALDDLENAMRCDCIEGEECTCVEAEDLDTQAALNAIKDEVIKSIGDGEWDYGVTLIRDSAFGNYIIEYVQDMHSDIDWNALPFSSIDWDEVASEYVSDYYSLEYDGVTYHYNA